MTSTPSSTSRSRPNRPNKRVIASGVIAGAAAGAWAANRLSRSAEPQPHRPMIDWEEARSIATTMNKASTLTAVERDRLDIYYRSLVDRAIPIVGDYVGIDLSPHTLTTHAFDRVDWVDANIDAFRDMLAPFESLASSDARGIFSDLASSANRKVVSLEIGLLLGYLARRVLGQYDIALLGREQMSGGRLFYVEPNIRHLETTLKLPGDDFRMWLALHETTHVFEFEGFPWVRPYFNSMLREYFGYLKDDAALLGTGLKNLRIFVERARSTESASTWLEHLMSPEQRALFDRMQTMMSVIEGYSNHVMNAVGRTLLPTFERIHRTFQQRQSNRSQAEILFAKVTGLDMKLEQYRAGERFIDAIAAERGHDFAVRVWTSPETLPTSIELKHPHQWIARIDRDWSSPAGIEGHSSP